MQALIDRIRSQGKNMGNGILKVNSFVNHQLDPQLTLEMGQEFARHFAEAGVTQITKVITAEVSGIAPAFATGVALNVPIIYARKIRPLTMSGDIYHAEAVSRTKGSLVELFVSPEYLQAGDRVLLIDDFIARGSTTAALVDIVQKSGAQLCGIGCVIEKTFEGGRTNLSHLGIPVISLAAITSMEGDSIHVMGPLTC